MATSSEYVNGPAGMLPPGAVIGAKFAGLTVNEWVTVASGILIALQLYVLVRDKLYRPWKEKRERSNRARSDDGHKRSRANGGH